MARNTRTPIDRRQIDQPFTPEQLAAIAALIPADEQKRADCMLRVVAATRRYLVLRIYGDASKTQGRDELIALLETTEKLRSQLSSLGVGARHALGENFVSNGYNSSGITDNEYLSDFITDMDMFFEFQRGAAEIAGQKVTRGAITGRAERRFVDEIDKSFANVARSDRGFWQILRIITESLSDVLPPHLCNGPYEQWRKAWREYRRTRPKNGG